MAPKRSAKSSASPKAAATPRAEKASRDFQDVATKGAIKEINELLEAKPEQVFGCLQALRDDFFLSKGESHMAEAWPSSYVRFDQIPKYWMISWLLSLGLFWTADALQSVDKSSRNGIRELVEFLTGIRMHSKLPRVCLSKQTLSRMLCKRFEVYGRHMVTQEWWGNLVDPETNQLAWWRPGCGVLTYVTEDGSDCVAGLRHNSGVTAPVPEEVALRESWQLGKNYSHTDVEVNRGILHLKFVQKCPQFDFLLQACSFENVASDAQAVSMNIAEKTREATEGIVEADPGLVQRKRRKGPPGGDGAMTVQLAIKNT